MLCPVKSSKIMSKTPRIEKAKPLSLDSVQFQVQYLQGRVLTILEAVIANQEQCKATKDIVRGEFNNTISWIVAQAYPSIPVMTRGHVASLGADVDTIEKEAEE